MGHTKRLLLCLTALALLFSAAAGPARADVLWEPSNSFYWQHGEECSYEDRGYLANGPEGYVTLWDAPGGVGALRQFENGTSLRVYWLYEDWGLVSLWEEGEELSGWVPMDQLLLKYDHISFEEDYGGQFRDYSGEFAAYRGDAETVNFFEYPGAPEVKDSRQLEDLRRNDFTEELFTDEQGRTWGYVGYMYGRIDGWFCLDEPDGTDFPLRNVDQAAPVPAQTPRPPLRAALPFLLVGGVVAVTLCLLIPYLRKKK